MQKNNLKSGYFDFERSSRGEHRFLVARLVCQRYSITLKGTDFSSLSIFYYVPWEQQEVDLLRKNSLLWFYQVIFILQTANLARSLNLHYNFWQLFIDMLIRGR